MNLTLQQQLQMEVIKRGLPNLSREEIESYLLESIMQRYFYQNTYNDLMKQHLGIDEIAEKKDYYSNIL